MANIINMSSFILGFQDIGKTKLMVVGSKGANLGELFKIEGIRVPDGFCISTEAFKRIIGETSSINELLDQLSLLKVDDRDKIIELSGEIRRVIEGTAIPEDINEEITRLLSRLGEKKAYAVLICASCAGLAWKKTPKACPWHIIIKIGHLFSAQSLN
jgi:phosphoenolpyruvate synthase/pyruvate phosphate dikinase